MRLKTLEDESERRYKEEKRIMIMKKIIRMYFSKYRSKRVSN